jgi:hypothetical protein
MVIKVTMNFMKYIVHQIYTEGNQGVTVERTGTLSQCQSETLA